MLIVKKYIPDFNDATLIVKFPDSDVFFPVKITSLKRLVIFQLEKNVFVSTVRIPFVGLG